MINSPGGSATQSHLIFKRIRALAAEKKLPVIAFIEDAGASGGYMIACAADEIVADESSIVGSIGVVGGSFGFNRLIEKIGVERRLYTSGDHKAMLDPFLPEKPDDVERLKAIQREIHEFFIGLVKTSRGAKLNGPEPDLFSGEYWTGTRALALGLIDRIGDLRTRVARALRRQGRDAAGGGGARPVRPPHPGDRCGPWRVAGPARARGRGHLGARGACDLGALRVIRLH